MAARRWVSYAAIGLIGVLGACTGSSSNSNESSAGGGAAITKGQVHSAHNLSGVAAPDAAAAVGTTFDSASSSSSVIPELGPRVIKNASLSLRVDRGRIQDAVRSVTTAAEGHRGYVVSTDFGGTDAESGSVTLRVPASEFEAALSDLEEIGHVTRQSVSGHDVSQEFIDLKARLVNSSAQEKVLLRLMDQAQTIEDTIRVQQQLEGVQLTIERLKGRIRYLDNETALSTISVSLVEAGAAPTKPASVLSKACARAGDVALGVLSGLVVAAGFVVPVAFLLALGFLVYRVVRPRLRFGGSA
ncbi:MAG: DUF4349 domain-containing protein [Actinomycetota bacterium]|nr:DUF4349 domain-containing protein [Actinomycetota bacterium]